MEDILETKKALDSEFTIKDLGEARYFLGIEICRTDHGTLISQRKYILDILTDSGLSALNLILVPYLKVLNFP